MLTIGGDSESFHVLTTRDSKISSIPISRRNLFFYLIIQQFDNPPPSSAAPLHMRNIIFLSIYFRACPYPDLSGHYIIAPDRLRKGGGIIRREHHSTRRLHLLGSRVPRSCNSDEKLARREHGNASAIGKCCVDDTSRYARVRKVLGKPDPDLVASGFLLEEAAIAHEWSTR